jgi:hypothetical protein
MPTTTIKPRLDGSDGLSTQI